MSDLRNHSAAIESRVLVHIISDYRNMSHVLLPCPAGAAAGAGGRDSEASDAVDEAEKWRSWVMSLEGDEAKVGAAREDCPAH
jgi:hypothetical protein